MKNDDLSQVKHIGPARMKRLNHAGITTIKQLCEMPLQKLAQIETIGEHYADQIKDAAAEHCKPAPDQPPAKTDVAAHKNKGKVDQNFHKQVKLFKRRLKQTTEKLKPLGKNKYLPLYIDLKKSSKQLMTQLKGIDRLKVDLPPKAKKKIAKKVDALNIAMKNVKKKPKKNTYNQITRKLQAFSEMIEKTSS